MNTWRRALLAGYSLLLVIFCALLAVLAWNQSRQLDLDSSGFRLTAGITAGDAEKVLFTLLLAMVSLFAVATFAIAVTPEEKRRTTLRLRHADGSQIDLAAPAIAAIIKREVELLPDVREASPAVAFVGERLTTDLSLLLRPGANLEAVGGAVTHTYAAALKEAFGITRAAEPVIRVSFDVRVGDGTQPPTPAGFEAPPMPRTYRQLVRPNDGNLEFPYEDR